MKKIIIAILCSFMGVTSVPVFAEEIKPAAEKSPNTSIEFNFNVNHLENEFAQNEKELEIVVNRKTESGQEIELYVRGEHGHYFFVDEEENGIKHTKIYDENGLLLTVVTDLSFVVTPLSEINRIVKNNDIGLLSNYESWSSYYLDRQGVMVSSTKFSMMTLALITSFLLYNLPAIALFEGSILTVASTYLNIEDVYIYYDRYIRHNLNCSILYQAYFDTYSNSSRTNYTGRINDTYFWTDIPWNYSYPAPCRTLESTYSYD